MKRIATAGWSVPKDVAASFAGHGTHLERYARVMRAVEIDSSFHRPHRTTTYARWAAATPDGFRFAVKLPKAVTHDARLVAVETLLDRFLSEVGGLGARLGVLLVQLPPSLAFDDRVADAFFTALRARHDGPVACEPRHASWFTGEADALLIGARIARVAADPAAVPAAAEPGGWLGPRGDGRDAIVYYRWHGSPRTYWSGYTDAWLAARALELARWPAATDAWCVFDNTAGGQALADALRLRALLAAAHSDA